MVDTIHSGSVGTRHQIALVENGAPLPLGGKTMTVYFQKPDESKFNRAGVAYGDPADGIVEYVSVALEFDMVGSWKKQAKVVDGSSQWFSDWIDFEVLPNLT